MQLLFELHTAQAYFKLVPPSLVHDKNKTRVQELFIGLHKVGYRLFSLKVNGGDPACAEVSMLYVGEGRSR